MTRGRKKSGPISAEELATMDDEIAKEFKDVEICWGDDEGLQVEKLALGIDSLDRVLQGGLAFNRTTLFIGRWSSGKTLMAMFAIKAAQKLNYSTVMVDAERSYDPKWAEVLGVDVGKLKVARPKRGEDAFNLVERYCRERVGVIVVDSLVACVPTRELDKQQSLPGARAQMINQGLARILVANTTSIVIGINQLREGIGVMFGNPETIPGGKGQSYFSHQIIRVRREGWITEGSGDNEKRIGYNLMLIVEKSKQGGMTEQASIPFLFSGAVDLVAGLVPLAIDMEIIEQDGAHYTVFGERFYGRKKLIEHVAGSEDVQERIRTELGKVPQF